MKIIDERPETRVADAESVSPEMPELAAASDVDAARSVSGLLSPQAIDQLLADADTAGVAVDGPGGLIQQMIGAVLERA